MKKKLIDHIKFESILTFLCLAGAGYFLHATTQGRVSRLYILKPEEMNTCQMTDTSSEYASIKLVPLEMNTCQMKTLGGCRVGGLGEVMKPILSKTPVYSSYDLTIASVTVHVKQPHPSSFLLKI